MAQGECVFNVFVTLISLFDAAAFQHRHTTQHIADVFFSLLLMPLLFFFRDFSRFTDIFRHALRRYGHATLYAVISSPRLSLISRLSRHYAAFFIRYFDIAMPVFFV